MIPDFFKPIGVGSLEPNFFNKIGDEWMLITAGTPNHFNTMTASWGGLGILWNKPVAICFIRPHRYTFEFAEKQHYFTLSFLGDKYRNILNFCGNHSGRDSDKIAHTGLLPVQLGPESISFEQAELIFECKKIYADFIEPENFVVRDIIASHYPRQDFHRFYIGEIVNCYKKKSEKVK